MTVCVCFVWRDVFKMNSQKKKNIRKPFRLLHIDMMKIVAHLIQRTWIQIFWPKKNHRFPQPNHSWTKVMKESLEISFIVNVLFFWFKSYITIIMNPKKKTRTEIFWWNTHHHSIPTTKYTEKTQYSIVFFYLFIFIKPSIK